MGTNYYLESLVPCPRCGYQADSLHIGKASAGWCFALHVIPEKELNSLDDWRQFIIESGRRIVDEYARTVLPAELLTVITERAWDESNGLDDSWYLRNYAEPGPNGLVRHQISTRNNCVGHGEGPWDYIVGDFS